VKLLWEISRSILVNIFDLGLAVENMRCRGPTIVGTPKALLAVQLDFVA